MSNTNTTVTGTVKRFRHQNDETGFVIAILDNGRAETTLVGVAPSLRIGEEVRATGAWASSNWGPQFKATDIRVEPPSTLEGMEMFLCNSVPGVGKGFAKKLLDAFGKDVFNVIEHEPDRLTTVPGIGKGRATSLVSAYDTQKAVRGIMVFLHSHGLSSKRAQKVFEKYGENAVEEITRNPYKLSEIRGIGFLLADDVADKLKVARDSEFRVRAGIKHILKEAQSNGSCGLPYHMLQDACVNLMGVTYELIDTALAWEVTEGHLVKDMCGEHEAYFLANMHRAEKEVATRLLRHNSRIPVVPVRDPLKTIGEIEAQLKLTLDVVQRDAAELALKNNIVVLTGGPGTGKTTISNVIIRSLKASGMNNILMCAPTGKAAKRASEATGLEVKTVHRLLGFAPDGKFKHNEKNPLVADAILIDESSMLDVLNMRALLRAIQVNTRIIIIGDKDQLWSVGPGKVLADIIESKAIPTVLLKVIFRQAAVSKIKTSAHMVNNGMSPPALGKEPGTDFWHYDFTPLNPKDEEAGRAKRAELRQKLLDMVGSFKGSARFDPIRDVQVLAPMYKGSLGVETLNVALQEMLNPHPAKSLVHNGVRWGIGDKVMQQRNNYEKNAMNGDVGYVVDIDLEDRLVLIEYDDGIVATYTTSELEEVKLAYAFTIHKSQGSEFPIVIMPVDYSHYKMLIRSIVYTGITRAKKLLILLTHSGALKKSVETVQASERFTRLAEWLRAGLPEEMAA